MVVFQDPNVTDYDISSKKGNFPGSEIDEVLIVAVTNIHGVITHVNDLFCKISGYERDELIGNTHRILNSGFHKSIFFKKLYDAISKGKIWRGKICNRAKNGNLYWVATTIIPRRDENGLIDSYIAYRFDVTLLVEAQNKMKLLVRQDPLVAAFNRIGFSDKLSERIKKDSISRKCFVLAMIDLNGFKEVNDIYGHDAGDTVLIEITRRLSRFAETDSVVARLGGDEFALILDYDKKDEILYRFQRLLDLIEEPVQAGVTEVSVSASIGYSIVDPATSASHACLKDVDIALLQAKNEVGQRIVAFTPSLHKRAGRHQQLISEARLGIDRDEFELFYQPIINLKDGKVLICEALLRWRHPVLGLITPGCFSEIFSDFRSGLAIGQFVRQRALKDMGKWEREKIYRGSVAINLSISDFGSGDLSEDIVRLAIEENIPRSRVHLEITENIFLGSSRSERVKKEIFNLSRNGFGIAFDDFGTGYAAISHLRELPLTHIKIDRSFIANIDRDNRDRKITSGLIALAHSIGLSTIAEGVETLEQLRILQELGCGACQGYLFARPVAADDLHQTLTRIENSASALLDLD
jgi:diguanylate cyclase (GGDEF)-like protein/PAS domain S-box-containing protein